MLVKNHFLVLKFDMSSFRNDKRRGIKFEALKGQELRISAQHGIVFWLKNLFIIFSCLTLVVFAVLAFKVGQHLMQVPKLSFLATYNPVQTIQIYDINDKLLLSVEGSEKRVFVPLSKVSKAMKMALLAAEDHRFYEHQGVSLNGVIRAVASNMSRGKVVEGGSTITQQLAKNLFFEGEKRTIDRKIAELMIAISIEKQFSKDKILELYLNEIYFGNNAYGIEQAARKYFAKPASQLDLADAAFLAGIIRAPSVGGAGENRDAAMRRQRIVLEKMLEYGFINEMEMLAAKQKWMQFENLDEKEEKIKISKYPYYVSTVIESLKGRFSQAEIEKQGLKIYTCLDTRAQDAAERTLAGGLARAPYGVNQGALVSIRVSDGAVLALVGGVGDFEKNQWNCATNPHTAGSAFKPFVYLAAFEKGLIEEYSTVDDSPFEIKDTGGRVYKPKNYDGKFMGGITVAKAFAYSRNIPALRIGQAAGIDSVMNVAERAGIKEPLAPELSLSLGCSAVSPLHMANAYATIARGGVFMPPCLIRKVESASGRSLDYFQSESQTVFDRNAVAQLVDLMQDCVCEGTGQLAKLKDRPVAGKTGTADQGKDLWFVGFTPDLVTAVWGGNKDNKAVGASVTGGTIMARIFHDYNQEYYKKVPIPAGIFIACNRAAQSLGTDKPLEKTEPAQVAASTPYVSEASTYTARKRRRKQNATRHYDYRRAPAGGAVVRNSRGVTEYVWSKK